MKYQFFRPPSLNQTKLCSYIEGINSRRQYTNNGPLVRALTERLEEYLGVENLLLVSSGTVALQVAYKALGCDGDVLTTPLSFVATSSAFKWIGKNIFFSDIDEKTLNLNPESLENNYLLRDQDVVVATHLYGNPCDISGFELALDNKGNHIIYDASHAFASRYKGRSVLAYGSASAVSFHATKLFHTIEGGAVVFSSRDDYLRAISLINFGFRDDRSIFEVGINAKMSELHAAVGLTILDDINSFIEHRSNLVDIYTSRLSSSGVLFIKQQPGAEFCSPSYFPLILSSREQRDKLHDGLMERGIESRKYFEPLLNRSCLFSSRKFILPVAEIYESRLLCLPLYNDLSNADAIFISEQVLIVMGNI